MARPDDDRPDPAPAPVPAPPRPPRPQAAQVHPIYGRLLRTLLSQAGADADRLLGVAGIDPQALMTQDAPLGIDAIVRTADMAIAATGRPWLGLDLGAQAPVTAHGSVGYAAVTAPDLREALRTLARFGALRNDAFDWRLDEAPAGGAALRFVGRVPLGAAEGLVVDATVSATLRVLEAAIGPLPATVVVDLPGAEPAWSEQYRRFGAVALCFGRGELRIAADAATLARPCVAADARAHAAACRACEDALAESVGGSLARRVAALLSAAGTAGVPTLSDLGRELGLSPRTLIRRLKAEGTSYQALLDAMRQERARWLLARTRRSIEDIAAELGYVDTSNFSRTVRRWFGTTPRALRAAARDTGAGTPE